jgi:1-acyl-sn-glycerol-3-phosphate acyltransferase
VLEVPALMALIIVFAIGVLIGALLAPLGSRRRPLRISTFALAYCGMEMAVLAVSFATWLRFLPSRTRGTGNTDRWIDTHRRILAHALGWVLAAARRCFGFRVAFSEASKDEALRQSGPTLVLARHGGPGDSFVLVHALLTRYHRRLHIVLKEILQVDPAIDILLNRVGCLFVRSPGGGGEGQAALLAEIARTLEPHESLLIFPEGANWTPNQRRRVIRHLKRAKDHEAARVATLMTNVLPPRSGGVLACLDARPDLGVVIVAHAGIDQVVSAAQVWDSLPLDAAMSIRIWPAAEIPECATDRPAWLTTEWAVIDEWVDGYHSGQLDQPAT